MDDILTGNPIECTSREAAKYLLGKKKVAILTGAGISDASGVPTFRGPGGMWIAPKKKYAGEFNPESVLTKSFFKAHPQANWKWHFDFMEILSKSKPNVAHAAIREF